MTPRSIPLCILLVLIAIVSSAQKETTGEAQIETLEKALQRHHIDHKEPALITALQDEDPRVRSLAARVLADDGSASATPMIEAALRREENYEAQATLALALAQLDDNVGREKLRSICNDVKLNSWIRINAAVNMNVLHDESCLPAVIGVLAYDKDDFAARQQALALVPSFRHLSPENFRVLLNLTVSALQDPKPQVRIRAAGVLSQVGDPSVLPALRRSLMVERSEACRKIISDAITELNTAQ